MLFHPLAAHQSNHCVQRCAHDKRDTCGGCMYRVCLDAPPQPTPSWHEAAAHSSCTSRCLQQLGAGVHTPTQLILQCRPPLSSAQCQAVIPVPSVVSVSAARSRQQLQDVRAGHHTSRPLIRVYNIHPASSGTHTGNMSAKDTACARLLFLRHMSQQVYCLEGATGVQYATPRLTCAACTCVDAYMLRSIHTQAGLAADLNKLVLHNLTAKPQTASQHYVSKHLLWYAERHRHAVLCAAASAPQALLLNCSIRNFPSPYQATGQAGARHASTQPAITGRPQLLNHLHPPVYAVLWCAQHLDQLLQAGCGLAGEHAGRMGHQHRGPGRGGAAAAGRCCLGGTQGDHLDGT